MASNTNQNQHTSLTAMIVGLSSLTFALLVAVLGLGTLLGHILGIDALIRFRPNELHTSFNSAACFTFLSIAVFCIYFEKWRIARLFISGVLVISLLTLVEYIFYINTGIDEIFAIFHNSRIVLPTNRMTKFGAVSHFFAAVSILLLTCDKKAQYCVTISIAIASFIIILSCLLIEDYYADLKDFVWGNYIQKNAYGFYGFMLLGCSILLQGFHQAILRGFSFLKYSPFFIIFIVLTTTILLTWESSLDAFTTKTSTTPPESIFYIGIFLTLSLSILLFLIQLAFYYAFKSEKNAAIMQAVLDSTDEGIVVFNNKGNVITYNDRFLKIWKLSAAQILKMNRHNIIKIASTKLDDNSQFFSRLRQIEQAPGAKHVDVLKLKNDIYLERTIKPYILNNKINGKIVSFRDVSTEKQLEKKLEHFTNYNEKTELPNLSATLKIFDHEISAARDSGYGVGVIVINIDKFARINDVFGSKQADVLIQDIAMTFMHNLPANCNLGHNGGGEFIVICALTSDDSSIKNIVNHFMKILENPFDLYGRVIRITCCAGIAQFPADGTDATTLLRKADIALHQAKNAGVNTIRFYSNDMQNAATSAVELEAKLHEAIKLDQFLVYYQPIIDLQSNIPVSVEALVRWKNESGIIMLPATFIPIAEETGLISSIGEIVLKKSLEQMALWIKQGHQNLRVSVNIAGHQFAYGALSKAIAQLLETSGIKPEHLELELTESTLFNPTEDLITSLRKFTQQGITVAIDDFGTGYSSFQYIKDFDIKKIKIDISFVRNINTDLASKGIVKAMIALAKSQGYIIVAEGIETKEQLETLKELGCDQGQGYYFAKPMPADECSKFLDSYPELSN